jgi:hypothetical protein
MSLNSGSADRNILAVVMNYGFLRKVLSSGDNRDRDLVFFLQPGSSSFLECPLQTLVGDNRKALILYCYYLKQPLKIQANLSGSPLAKFPLFQSSKTACHNVHIAY